MTVFTTRPVTRRLLLGAGATVGLSGLVGCSNAGRGGAPRSGSTIAASQVRPAYVQYKGVKPDYDGSHYGIPDGFEKYPDHPVKAIDTPPGDGKPITTMSYTNRAVPPKLSQNPFWQHLNKAVGSEVQISLTASVDYSEKFATTVAGNGLPDVFQVGSLANKPQMLAAKALDLTPYLGGSASQKYPFLANLPQDGWNFGIFGGRLYGIPIPRGAISTSVLYARKDKLEEKGLPAELKNADDFVALCKELTDARANVFALDNVPTGFVQNMWGIANGWKIENDSLISANEDPAQEDVLNLLIQLWQARYIHPDAFTSPNTDLILRYNNGVCPLRYNSFSGFTSTLPDPNTQIPSAFIAPPGHDGSDIGKPWLGSPAISVTAISKAAEDRAEVMLSYLNFLASPFGTQEYLIKNFGVGSDYTMKDGVPTFALPVADNAMGLEYQAAPPYTLFFSQTGAAKALFDGMKEIVPNAIANPVIGMYSETENTKGPQINTKLSDVQNNIIQGRQPVSAWAPAVKAWKAGGGDKIAEELYAVYKSSK